MSFFKFLSPKKNVKSDQINTDTVTAMNLGITEHGLEGRPDLLEDIEVYSKDEGDFVHWFRATTGNKWSFDPKEVGSGHPSYSRTTYSDHKYVGSVKLPNGWIFDQCNNRICSPSGECFGFSELMKGMGK